MTERQFTGKERLAMIGNGGSATLDEVSPAHIFSRALSNAELRHLHSSPLQLLPAPGDGFAYIVLSSVYQNVKVGASFDDGVVGLFYGNTVNPADGGSSAAPFGADDTINQPSTNMTGANSLQSAATTDVNNKGIWLSSPTGLNWSAGDGYGRVTFLYFILPLQMTAPV